MLTKHQAVLDMVYATNESVCMRAQPFDDYPMVTFTRQAWEDMGEPQTVTVTVEPGDRLNWPRDPRGEAEPWA